MRACRSQTFTYKACHCLAADSDESVLPYLRFVVVGCSDEKAAWRLSDGALAEAIARGAADGESGLCAA